MNARKECAPADGGRRCETHGRPLYPDGRCREASARPCVMCGTEEPPICCMVCLKDVVRRAAGGEKLPEYVDARGVSVGLLGEPVQGPGHGGVEVYLAGTGAEHPGELTALRVLGDAVFDFWAAKQGEEGSPPEADAWTAVKRAHEAWAETLTLTVAPSAQKLMCAWFDEDAEAGGIYRCAKPATHYSCNNGPREQVWNACEEHKCRCAQPAAPVDDEHADTTNEKEKNA